MSNMNTYGVDNWRIGLNSLCPNSQSPPWSGPQINSEALYFWLLFSLLLRVLELKFLMNSGFSLTGVFAESPIIKSSWSVTLLNLNTTIDLAHLKLFTVINSLHLWFLLSRLVSSKLKTWFKLRFNFRFKNNLRFTQLWSHLYFNRPLPSFKDPQFENEGKNLPVDNWFHQHEI